MNNMKIGGFSKITLLDFPDNVACIVFTKGCNFNCPFCQNVSLILDDNKDLIDESEIFEYLEKRKNVLDGISISGGEPFIQKKLKDFILKVKNLGLKVKIDTNGSNPVLLKELINNNLLDYIAMDIKNSYEKYDITSGTIVNIDNIKESIKLIEESSIKYEFRTTIIKEFHNIDDIVKILSYIDKKSKYYIQNYTKNSDIKDQNLNSFTNEELENMKEKLSKKYENITFRDI